MFYSLHCARPRGRGLCAGFTLIELLVVVLIIGILAAVALPKYRIAVEKSRAVQALTLVRSLREAQQRYKMATGEYSPVFDNLDVRFNDYTPAACRSGYSQDCRNIKGFLTEFYASVDEIISVEAAADDYYIVGYMEPSRRAKYGSLTCIAATETGHIICKGFGGKVSEASARYYILEP